MYILLHRSSQAMSRLQLTGLHVEQTEHFQQFHNDWHVWHSAVSSRHTSRHSALPADSFVKYKKQLWSWQRWNSRLSECRKYTEVMSRRRFQFECDGSCRLVSGNRKKHFPSWAMRRSGQQIQPNWCEFLMTVTSGKKKEVKKFGATDEMQQT